MLKSLRVLTDALLSALIAPVCASCARLLDRPLEGAVCEACWSAIAATAARDGSRVGLPLLARSEALGEYDGVLRAVIHALKYDGRRSVAPRLSRMMADCGRDILAGADAVIPVPLHPHRQRQRGFNQAEDLTRELGLPVLGALKRIKRTHPQVDLPAADRQLNVRDAFVVVPCRARDWRLAPRRWQPRDAGLRDGSCNLADATLVLVDDVATTGATLEACARVLTGAGAREIRALTAARVATAPRPARAR